MKPEEQKRKEYFETLVDLQDRMMKAGLIVSHGQSQKGNAVELSPAGSAFAVVFDTLDKTIGPLTKHQVICLWDFFKTVAKQQHAAGGTS